MTKEEIRKICHEHSIKNYSINSDMSIDVNGTVNFYGREFKQLPLIFNKVSGHFDCHSCTNLVSLQGSPKEVDGYFDCSDCINLTSLQGAPKEVGKDFSVTRERIRQIEVKALRKLKHPSRSKKLLAFFEKDFTKTSDMRVKSYWVLEF